MRAGTRTAAGLVALLAAPAAQDLLANGGFEAGLEGWTALGGAEVVAAGAGAAEGTSVLELRMEEDLSVDAVLQRLALEPDAEYELSLSYQRSFAEPKYRLPLTLDEFDPHSSIGRVTLVEPATDHAQPVAGEWHGYSTRFFAVREDSTLQLGPVTFPFDPLPGGKVWLDDVRVTATGGAREVGVDHDFLAFLPSDAVVGEPVALHVSCIDLRGEGGPFEMRDMPVRTRATMSVATDDAAAFVPASIDFDGERWQSFVVRFQTPGVHRVTLTHPNGHVRLSNPVRVAAAPPATRRYWGDVHVHTTYQHGGWGAGDAYQNLAYARDVARLDFASLTEHNTADVALPYIRQMSDATELFHEPGRFVTFFGAETSTVEGHHNTYLRGDDRFAMADSRHQNFAHQHEKLDFYRSSGTAFLNVPHHFALLKPVDWRLADREAQTVVELYSNHGSSEVAGEWWRHPDQHGVSYAASMGAEGHDYLAALARGHRLGVLASSDNHRARPGFEGLTCVVAPALERGAVWDELQARHCYATSGARILVDFELAATPMGDEARLAPGTPLVASVSVSGTSAIERIELVSEGAVLAAFEPGTLDFVHPHVDLGTFDGETTHVYLRVFQEDEHRAWSSPIWVSPRATPDLLVEHRDLEFDHGSGTLTVRPRNYGDAPATAEVALYSSAGSPALVAHEPGGDELSVVTRAEPLGDDRVLLRVHLYTPKTFNEVFTFSGELRLEGAEGYEVVVDPRAMLVDDGDGRLTWDEGPYGHDFSGPASHSGQVTDFAVLVRTGAATTLTASFARDGLPIPGCYLGSERSPVAGEVSLALGGLPAATALGSATVTVMPHAFPGLPEAVEFPGLAPGHTYVAALDPGEQVQESDELNNAQARAVFLAAASYVQWPDVPVPPPLPELEVTPRTGGMPLGATRRLRARALYPDGQHANATDAVTWVPDPDLDGLVRLLPDGRLRSGTASASARVHARLELGSQARRSNDAVVWASGATRPAILSAGYGLTYLDQGSTLPLTVTARVAQRDDFADGEVSVFLVDPDGAPWAPGGVPVELRDDGAGGDDRAGDGIFTAVVDPGPQLGAAGFGLGEQVKALRALYALPGEVLSEELPWPYVAPAPGADPAPPFPVGTGWPPSPDDEAFFAPRIVSAGARGFGGTLHPAAGAGGAIGVAGGGLVGQAAPYAWLFLEVEIALASHPAFEGAEHRVLARLPWRPEEEVALTASPHDPRIHTLLEPIGPWGTPDLLPLVELRAEALLPVDLGTKAVEWWSSDVWPRLVLHDFLGD